MQAANNLQTKTNFCIVTFLYQNALARQRRRGLVAFYSSAVACYDSKANMPHYFFIKLNVKSSKDVNTNYQFTAAGLTQLGIEPESKKSLQGFYPLG